MRYGTPYKGSKNKIAAWVVQQLPKKTHFYDLFAGGCAVTHAALLSEKYTDFRANDIGDAPQLFTDAAAGKLSVEKRWISREDFSRLKDSEPYVRYCWSFGNNGKDYLYAKEVEPWKRALHYARVLGDFSELEKFGIHTRDAGQQAVSRKGAEYKQKYIAWYCSEVLHSRLDALELQKSLTDRIERSSTELRAYLVSALKRAGKRPSDVDRYLGTNGMAGHYFGKSQWAFPTREVYIKLHGFIDLPQGYDSVHGLQELLESLQSLQRLQRLQSLQSLQSLESLERLQSLQSLQSLESLERLEVTRGDYRDVHILPDSVIYCDIPYRNTNGYGTGFDYDAFYDWCGKQTELVTVSEYSMPPELFERIAVIDKQQLLNGTGTGRTVHEGLFVPKHQVELYRTLMAGTVAPDGQLLFDFVA